MRHAAVLLALLPAAVASCAAVPYDPGARFEDAPLRRALGDQVAAGLPRSFRAVHRAVLEIGDREYDLEGYLLVKRPDRLRLVAKGSLAGTAFDVACTGKGGARVLRNPVALRDTWVTGGALRDAAALYLRRPSPEGFLVRHHDGTIGLARSLADGTREEFTFAGAPPRLTGVVRSRDGALLYEVVFDGERRLPSWPNPVPATIRVRDLELGYRLTIEVVSLRAVPIDDRLFSPEQAP